MTTQKKTVEELVKEFEKNFTYGVLYSASSDLTGGEGTHFKMYDAKPAIQWLKEALTSHASSAVAAREAELRERIEGMKKPLQLGKNPSLENNIAIAARNLTLSEVLALLPENKSTDL